MSFFENIEKPVLTVILSGNDSKERVIELINEAISEGTEAFCLQFEHMKAEDRSRENYREIIAACQDKPVYATCYLEGNTLNQTDDEIEQEILMLQECGAKLLDIRTDMFDPSEKQISTDPTAIARQKKLIDEIHARGGEVLMSSHTSCYMSPEEVLDLLKMQQSRGVDVCKAVTVANTDEELADAYITAGLIRRELHQDHLFLVGGDQHCDFRFLGNFLGSSLLLCTVDSRPGLQPPISSVKKVKELRNAYRDATPQI